MGTPITSNTLYTQNVDHFSQAVQEARRDVKHAFKQHVSLQNCIRNNPDASSKTHSKARAAEAKLAESRRRLFEVNTDRNLALHECTEEKAKDGPVMRALKGLGTLPSAPVAIGMSLADAVASSPFGAAGVMLAAQVLSAAAMPMQAQQQVDAFNATAEAMPKPEPIVGGHKVTQGLHTTPHVYVKSKSGTCTGTMLDNRHVLTAVHCVADYRREGGRGGMGDMRFDRLTPPSEITVCHPQDGAVSSCGSSNSAKVDRTFVSHGYFRPYYFTDAEGSNKDSDIAVLRLKNPIPGHTGINYIPRTTQAQQKEIMASCSHTPKEQNSISFTAQGYGLTESGKASGCLKEASVQCTQINSGLVNTKGIDGQINGGDSGGSLVAHNTAEGDVIIGTVATSDAGLSATAMADYVDVTRHNEWIDDVVGFQPAGEDVRATGCIEVVEGFKWPHASTQRVVLKNTCPQALDAEVYVGRSKDAPKDRAHKSFPMQGGEMKQFFKPKNKPVVVVEKEADDGKGIITEE
ncbi:MAG: S1 family peptidase [Gammaproteobacteria bacterium]|nr:S1 family peptidase [Gammaproteobacteria bacterium]